MQTESAGGKIRAADPHTEPLAKMAFSKPTPRRYHTAVSVGHRQFTWGGETIGEWDKSKELASIVEVFDLSSEQWETKRTRGPLPPGYLYPAYTVMRNKLYTFGGYDGGSSYNSLHCLDLSSLEWEEVVPKNMSVLDAPRRKYACGMVSFRDDKLVVFAGWTDDHDQMTNEFHVFSTTEGMWSSPPATGTKPPPCSRFTLTKMDDHLAVLFGGNTREHLLVDVFMLELGKWHWTRLEVSGPKPPARAYHAACCLAGPFTGPVLMVMGGIGELANVHNDGWLLDVDQGRWMEVDFPAAMQLRWGHIATVFGSAPGFRQLVLHGGRLYCQSANSVTATTLLNLELQRGSWRVTGVIPEDQLGRPEERLREKMEKLWPSLLPTQQTSGDGERAYLEQRLREAESRATEADRRARAAEETATTIRRQAQMKVEEAELRASSLQQRLHQTEQRAKQAEERADEAEREASFLQQQVADTEMRAREERVVIAEQRSRETEMRAERSAAYYQDDQHSWVVHKEEIELTNRELGRGGWAVVRVARFRGTQVAAKCLHSLIISDYNRQLFVREMNMAARIRHPNLIQFIGATLQGEPIILTELMATSLRAILERQSLNPLQITSISQDVARALNYLHLMHPNPIIHRDVSSANVLLDPRPNSTWQAKVSDYGTTNFVQRVTTAGPGNPAYAAPEAANPRQQSPKMDVYSYGVVLLETCTRRFPDPDNRDGLLQSVTQPAMVELIRRCLEQEPERRPTMSEIVEQSERV